jgi:hypothetical protein
MNMLRRQREETVKTPRDKSGKAVPLADIEIDC